MIDQRENVKDRRNGVTMRPYNMAFGADKPFVMKIAYAIFPPSLCFAQARLAAQKIVIFFWW